MGYGTAVFSILLISCLMLLSIKLFRIYVSSTIASSQTTENPNDSAYDIAQTVSPILPPATI